MVLLSVNTVDMSLSERHDVINDVTYIVMMMMMMHTSDVVILFRYSDDLDVFHCSNIQKKHWIHNIMCTILILNI